MKTLHSNFEKDLFEFKYVLAFISKTFQLPLFTASNISPRNVLSGIPTAYKAVTLLCVIVCGYINLLFSDISLSQKK